MPLFSRPSLFLWTVPLGTLVLAASARMAAGPFWLGLNSDPAYLYLFNASYLLNGIVPMFTDHPGTTLQLLLAALLRAVGPHAAGQELVAFTALQAEPLLCAGWAVLAVLFAVSLRVLGGAAHRATGSKAAAVVAQAGGLLFLLLPSHSHPGTMPVLANVSAEALLVTFMNGYFSILLRRGGGKGDAARHWALLGLVAAGAFVTKMTCLPFVALPLFLLSRSRSFFSYLAGLLLGMLLLTSPVWYRASKWWDWTVNLLMKTGPHGSGGDGLLFWPQWSASLANLTRQEWPLLLLAVLSIRFAGRAGARAGLLRAVAIAMPCQLLFCAKQGAPQYMAPAVAGAGVMAALLIAGLPDRRARAVGAALSVLLLSLLVVGNLGGLRRVRDAQLAFRGRVHEWAKKCTVACAYRASAPEYALFFGHSIHYYEHGAVKYFRPYGPELAALFPQVVILDVWTGMFYGFGRAIDLSELAARHGCLVVQTSDGGRLSPEYFHEVASSPMEKLYELR